MNEFNKYKILSYYKEAKTLKKYGILLFPRMISVWPTHNCNMNCDYCLFGELVNKDRVNIDTRKFCDFITDVSKMGVEGIEFSGGGEPGLHPDLQEIAMHITANGMRVGILTNGTNIDAEKICDVYSYIRVSLDYADKEQYVKFKKPASDRLYDKVIQNIKSLVETRKSKYPTIGVKFLLSSTNYKDVEKMVKLARDLGVDYVQFKPTHNTEYDLSEHQAAEADRAIETLRAWSFFPIIGRATRLCATVKCFMSPIHTVINALGDVFICCYFRTKEMAIGNIFTEDFKKFWGGERHHDLVKKLGVEDCNKFDCRWHYYNSFMEKVIAGEEVNISFI